MPKDERPNYNVIDDDFMLEIFFKNKESARKAEEMKTRLNSGKNVKKEFSSEGFSFFE